MAKSLLDILSPLMTTPEAQPRLDRLYQELVLLCPTEENQLVPQDEKINAQNEKLQEKIQLQANKIRTRLAEELWKRGTGPNEYPDEELAVIYEAGQQITHEYPTNKDPKTGKFECLISLDDIELGEEPQPRDNTAYAFSVVSGCVYKRESLKYSLGDARFEPLLDPINKMFYSPYEIQMLGVTFHHLNGNNRARSRRIHQEEDTHFVLGINEREYAKRMWISCVAALIMNPLYAVEMFGNSFGVVLNALFFIPMAFAMCVFIFSSVGVAFAKYARETNDPILRTQYLMNARTAALVGSAIILTPLTLETYSVLGKITGKMLARALGAGDSADQAAQAGMILAPVFALVLIIPLIKSYWDLRHLRVIDRTRNAEEQMTRNKINNDLVCIASSVALCALGYLTGLPMKFLSNTPAAENSATVGAMAGFLLGVMMTCIIKGEEIIQSCEGVVGWGRRRGAGSDNDQQNLVEMTSINATQTVR